MSDAGRSLHCGISIRAMSAVGRCCSLIPTLPIRCDVSDDTQVAAPHRRGVRPTRCRVQQRRRHGPYRSDRRQHPGRLGPLALPLTTTCPRTFLEQFATVLVPNLVGRAGIRRDEVTPLRRIVAIIQYRPVQNDTGVSEFRVRCSLRKAASRIL